MRLTGIIVALSMLLAVPAYALTISYEITPELVLPNGYADCFITIRNSGASSVEINSISFFSKTIEFEPASIQSVGNLSPGAIYTLKVSMKSQVVGRQNGEMIVSTSEGSLSQSIELIVDDKFPDLSLSSPLYRGEVNNAKLLISSPVTLRNIQVEALFNATPKKFFLGSLTGVNELNFRLGEELENLKFKISFYNGRSYHEIERVIKADYLPSKGIAINLQPSKDVLFIGEAVNLSLEITNLRSDEIYKLEVQLFGSGKFSQNNSKIDRIASNDKKLMNFIFSPREKGISEISAKIKYKDFFGNEYEKYEYLTLNVLDSHVLQMINLQKTPSMGKLKISGEIVNYGHRSALNTKVSAFCEESRADYYIGEIEAKDYETFDLEISCTNVTLSLTWWNDAGDNFSISEELKAEKMEKIETNPMPIYVGFITSIFVIGFVIYLLLRARRK
ncbi:MAG: hypothetical protein NZ872_02180 [Archaeoglobaceae archaeon]|nr:hypothetical protein [Archaeoglobaceae archaeon]MDW8128007.1 hypothetical protein [Archaeoglobaceae archaeon]